jgi:uncharacterized protein (TIGR00369 family)
MSTPPATSATLRMAGTLPGLLGIEVTELGEGFALGRMVVQPHHLAPNGYLHAASVVALADTVAGYGCFHNRPEGATGFTTIELKSNFLGTARAGAMACEARLQHGGRTTQVWDATVRDGSGKQLALFRCTQLLIYPRAWPWAFCPPRLHIPPLRGRA